MTAGIIAGLIVIVALHVIYSVEVARQNRRPLGGETGPEEEDQE